MAIKGSDTKTRPIFWPMIFLLVGLAGIASPAWALDPIPNASGFDGYLEPSVGFIRLEDNMVAKLGFIEIGDDRIDSLGDSPDAETTAIIGLDFNLGYTFASTRTRLFVGTMVEDMLRYDLSQQLGVMQEAGRLGNFSAGLLFSGVTSTVWEDPYVTGRKRRDTDRSDTGLRLVWDKILGTNCEFQYSRREIDIDDERSGTFLGLSAADRGRLDREGTKHRFSMAYDLKLSDRHRLVPQFIYTYDDRDGSARKNKGYHGLLTYVMRGDPLTLILNGSYGYVDYDSRNPIYGKTQEDDVYGIAAAIYYKNPFGWSLWGSDRIHLVCKAGYLASEANIDFYESTLLFGSVGIAYRF
jgi:hypothetical protein